MTTNRPLIAVTPLMDYGRDSLWMLPGYMEAIMRAWRYARHVAADR